MAATERVYQPGNYLFRENEGSQSLFVIRKGTVSIRKAKDNAFVEISRAYTNEVLGEISFFDREPRSASAIALTEVEALEIQFVDLEKILASVPPYLRTIMTAMADRLRKTSTNVKKLQTELVTEYGEVEKEGEGKLDATSALQQAGLRVPGAQSNSNSDDSDGS